MIDTGSGSSYLSESEARRVGLTVQSLALNLGTADRRGKIHLTGVAVVNDLAIGDFHLQNVPFRLTKDSGEIGTVGMNILLALETFAWSADGTFEVGLPPGQRNIREANLCFHVTGSLHTEAEFRNNRMSFMLDTGYGAESFLYDGFAKKYAALLRESGTKSKYDPGFWGRPARKEDALILTSVTLRAGGCDAVLPSVPVLLKQVGNEPWNYGNLGMNLFNQAKRVSLDFRAMKLKLEGCEQTGP
jgi:hypothetical protein